MKSKKVLLIGNGINDVTASYTWGDLIKDLISFAKSDRSIIQGRKPFPLLYEEIYLKVAKGIDKKEIEFKNFIAKKIKALKPSNVHKKIMSLNFENLLTTNYDYCLESSISTDNDYDNKGIIKESLYSVFRHTNANKSNIWHIHGEMRIAKTILLGYEHYSGMLQQMRNYIVSGTGDNYKSAKFPSLNFMLRHNKVEYASWLDFFFKKEVHIIGLSLSFAEIDLWWLLTYRARRKKRLPINNQIYYYYPKSFEKRITDMLDLLQASDVITISLDIQHSIKYYDEALDLILKT